MIGIDSPTNLASPSFAVLFTIMLSGTKLEYTRRHNRRIIVETIRRNGPISRIEVAHLTGLTTATVSNLTAELLQREYVIETGRRKGQRGQPAIELEINPNGRFSIGFEIGRDHFAGVLINLKGDILAKTHHEWKFPTPDEALHAITEHYPLFLNDADIPAERLLGVGVAMPGPFLTNHKDIVIPANFPGWEHFPVVETLTHTLRSTVSMENDVMAAAIGEQFHGEGQDYRDFYYLYLGAGIGGAMILNGHPYQGFSPNTGEVGRLKHLTRGRYAVIAHVLGLDNLYSFLQGSGVNASNPQHLERLFQDQDIHLWEWLNEAVECLDTVINAINLIVGPEAIFLGGHFPNSLLSYLIERLELEFATSKASQPDKYVSHHAKLLRAASGDLSSAIGAATLPLYGAFSTQYALIRKGD